MNQPCLYGLQDAALAPTPGQAEYVAGFWLEVRRALLQYPLTAATRLAVTQLACAGNGFPQVAGYKDRTSIELQQISRQLCPPIVMAPTPSFQRLRRVRSQRSSLLHDLSSLPFLFEVCCRCRL